MKEIKVRPMKPYNYKDIKDPSKLRFPLLATTKIDGIRFLTKRGEDGIVRALSASLKPIRNEFVQSIISKVNIAGLDGELAPSLNPREYASNDATSAFMAKEGEPFTVFYLFDYWGYPEMPYQDRLKILDDYLMYFKKAIRDNNLIDKAVVLSLGHQIQRVNNPGQIEELFLLSLSRGFEGLVMYDPKGLYKSGRSTLKEQYSIKMKKTEDSEAVIVGYNELMKNVSESKVNERGLKEKDHKRGNMTGADTLGSLIVDDPMFGQFSIGSGFSDSERHYIWANQDRFMGKLVKYSYMGTGVLKLPRHPVFMGFRDEDDMTSY
jgi:DNA ligase-1